MDNAVALVQAYLRLNGYFTVTEYPVVATSRDGGYRTATDLDLLAFRFPGAGRLVPGPGRRDLADEDHSAPDPALGVSAEHADMILGEVKEGRAVLNAAARDPAVLRSVLVAFGCCSRAEAPQLVDQLLREGDAMLPDGHRIRMVVFGSITDGTDRGNVVPISLGHVVRFLRAYLQDHWEVLRHSESKDPALGFLMTLEKAERGGAATDSDGVVRDARRGATPHSRQRPRRPLSAPEDGT